jgi:hypothetical protein
VRDASDASQDRAARPVGPVGSGGESRERDGKGAFDVVPDGKFYPVSSDTIAAFRLTGNALQATFKGPTGQSDAVTCTLSARQRVMTCNGVLKERNGRTANYVDVYDRI